MFTCRRPLRAFFSIAFAALLLASAVAAQDKPAGAPSPSDPTALPILNLNPLARPTPEKTAVAQDSFFDFTLPRMKPVGLIPPSNRGKSSMSQAGAGSASGPLQLTLEEALARAVATNALVAASAGVSAAHYHHKALQSDYFPKVGAYLVNLHFNKFMGDTIQLFRRGIIFPTVSRTVPLFNKDQTYVGPTVTQPLTPLFKVHEAVRIAKADERIAQAKANAASVQLAADVERAYFDLLIAQRRQTEAWANVEMAELKLQVASAAAAPVNGMTERETALARSQKSAPHRKRQCDGVDQLSHRPDGASRRRAIGIDSAHSCTNRSRIFPPTAAAPTKATEAAARHRLQPRDRRGGGDGSQGESGASFSEVGVRPRRGHYGRLHVSNGDTGSAR